ncbi:hypothetical protein [Sphingobium sp. HDIP04]|uniref:hypothetical protein n=1 Tax=Sphingobium sp. HDIP04 TaxID=428994 RepID=UPI0004190554|nr:hypothetical protein [Sphingobium sp. HDIP04]
MGQARDEAGNIWETDAQGNAVRLIQPAGAAPQQGTVIRNPWKAKEEARKDEDQAIQRRNVQLSEEAAARDAQARREASEKAARERAEWESTHNPDGSLKVKASPDRGAQVRTLLNSISRLRELSQKRLAVGNWSGSFKDNALFNQNRKNVEGALEQLEGDMIQQQIMVLNEANGGKGVASLANSETEARRMAASIANLNPDQDLAEFTRGLDEAESYYLRQAAKSEGREVDADLISEYLPEKDRGAAIARFGISRAGGTSGYPNSGSGSPGPYQNDPSGNRTFLTERDKAFAEEAQAAFRNGADRAAMDAIAQRYGAQPFGEDLEKAIASRRAGNASVQFAPTPTGFEERGLTGGFLKAFGLEDDSVVSPFAIGAANALTAGQLGNIAGLTGSSEGGTAVAMDMAQDNVLPYFLGELGGGALATFGAGKALGAGSRLVSNPTVASLLANPLTADAAYGAAYGASEADDPLYGAVGGALTALGGSYLGGKAGGFMGGSRIDDPLNRGERAVINAMDRGTGISVEEALQQGQDLGLPMTLADVSPEVAALAGSAIRRNPTVAGQARDMLARRSQGQIDRFRGAVARDLGPLDNVPQRADDLIEQARVAAGPLYDEARATPIPSTPTIESLLQTPFAQQGLGRARTIAANERRSPQELGFSLDANGDVIVTPNIPMTLTSAGQAGGEVMPTMNYTTEALDYAKRGMDSVLEKYRNDITGKLDLDDLGRSENSVLRSLLNEMDRLNPAYGQARAAYAGPAAEREALHLGKSALTENPDLLAIQAGRQTPKRLELMQLGARDRLVKGAENLSNSTNPFRILNTPAMEQRLNILYPDAGDDVARLLLQRDLENRMAGTSNFLIGNSSTAERGLADQAFGDEGLLRPVIEGGLETAISGAPVMTIGRRLGGQWLKDRSALGVGRRAAERAEQIAPIALNPDPADTVAQILEMQARQADYQAAVEAAKEVASRRGSRFGTVATTATYPYWMGD